jgi:two-component system phosphate regulon sensor histidine kinase PhoR
MRITIFRRLLSMGVLYILSITILVCIGMFFFTRNAVLETIGHEARTVAAFSTNVANDAEAWKSIQQHNDRHLRLTIIDPSGAVLYESERSAAGMDNHKDRPEIKAAFETGESHGERMSATMGVSTFYYAVKAPNGYVIRVATEASSLQTYLYGGFLVAFLLTVIYIISLYYVARRMSEDIVKPIEAAFRGWTHKRGTRVLKHLSQSYVELEPLVETLQKQQTELNDYISSETKRRQEFSANIAHELKTPLTTISGYAELLKAGYVNSVEESLSLGEKIYNASQRMLGTIESILHLSEIEADMWGDLLTAVDAKSVWQQAWKIVETKDQVKQNQVTFAIAGDIPQVEGHPSLLLEMAVNLLDNAVKYSKPGDANAINLTLSQDGGMAKMVLTDVGIGIPADKVNRIFERFYRVDPSRNNAKVSGTGVGLALVKHIVDVHKGTIEVASEEGHGTTFTVEIPFK